MANLIFNDNFLFSEPKLNLYCKKHTIHETCIVRREEFYFSLPIIDYYKCHFLQHYIQP